MNKSNTQEENPLAYNYVRVLRFFLYPIGGWPGELFGEKMPFIVRYHRKHIPAQSLIVFIGGIIYLNTKEVTFILKGHCLITGFLALLTLFRSLLPNVETYGKLVKKFLMTFQLGYFKHKGKYDLEMYTIIDKISYYCALYSMTMMVGGMMLFNLTPCYKNYMSGAFGGKLSDNATYEFSVYYSYPGFDPHHHFIMVTIINILISYHCSVFLCSIDLLLYLMVFQLIGHILILQHNLETFPKPAKHIVENFDNNCSEQMIVTVEMYDADENRMIHEKLVECVIHHRMIVSFTKELSTFFGPVLGFNYGFHLVCCCLLLLECSQGDPDALMEYGPLTVIIFGQLIQMSVIFEIVNTVSEKLIDSAYATPWEFMNTKNRRTVCFLLNRVQTPIQVTIIGRVGVGVETMAAILRSTFTYFAFLQSIHE